MKQVVRKNIAEANGISNEPPILTLLVDGNNLLKISTSTHETSTYGLEYGAVMQFFIQLKKMLEKRDFNFVYVFFDAEGSGLLRYEYYKDYKKNRDKNYAEKANQSDYDKFINSYVRNILNHTKEKSQNNRESDEDAFERQKMIVQQCLEEIGIRQIECENVEGDDLIAYYVKNKKENENVIIYSGDRDISQLISPSVMLYIPNLHDYIHINNHKKVVGFTHENVLLKKIFCGDVSDSIKGIKGCGETTFWKLFPEAIDKKMTVDEIIETSKKLLEERKAQKLKPLKVLENIVNGVTDGCQGDKIYEINKKIIDLSEPMLTDEAKEEMDNIMYAPLDMTYRSIEKVYDILTEHGCVKFLESAYFSGFFAPFSRIYQIEKQYAKKNLEKC